MTINSLPQSNQPATTRIFANLPFLNNFKIAPKEDPYGLRHQTIPLQPQSQHAPETELTASDPLLEFSMIEYLRGPNGHIIANGSSTDQNAHRNAAAAFV